MTFLFVVTVLAPDSCVEAMGGRERVGDALVRELMTLDISEATIKEAAVSVQTLDQWNNTVVQHGLQCGIEASKVWPFPDRFKFRVSSPLPQNAARDHFDVRLDYDSALFTRERLETILSMAVSSIPGVSDHSIKFVPIGPPPTVGRIATLATPGRVTEPCPNCDKHTVDGVCYICGWGRYRDMLKALEPKSARPWLIRKSIFGRWTPLHVVVEVVKFGIFVFIARMVLKAYGC